MSDQTVESPVVETTVTAPAAEVAEVPKVEEAAADAKVEDKGNTRDEEKAKVLKQVEFYFSDSNLPNDKFMSEMVKRAQDGCMYY